MSEYANGPNPGEFSWNEPVSNNVDPAKKFYTGLFGWKAEAFTGGTEYTPFKQGDTLSTG